MAEPPPPPPPPGETAKPPPPPPIAEAAQPPPAPPLAEAAQPPSATPQGNAAQPPPAPPQAEEAQPPSATSQGEAAQPQQLTEKAKQTALVQSRHPEMEKFIAAVSIVCIILTGLMIAIVWLPALPKKLEYSVESASIGGYNLSGDGRLSADLHFAVRAYNPSKAGASFHYDKIDATASYRGVDLISAEKAVPAFYQARRNATDLNLNLTAKGEKKVGNETVVGDLRMERGKGGLDLKLKIGAKMTLKIGALKVIHRTLNVTCGPFKVPFSSSSSSSSSSRAFQRVFCDAHIGE